MTADSRLARAVPAPEFGADFVLRFTTGDLCELREKHGLHWIAECQKFLEIADPVFIRDSLKIGLKGPGGFVRPENLDLDDLPVAPGKMTVRISDAITAAVTGQSYADLLTEREKTAESQRDSTAAE